MQEIAQGCVDDFTLRNKAYTAFFFLLGRSICTFSFSSCALRIVSMPHSQNFNEIMPCIYARFMEKEAKQWRQIYKVRGHLVAMASSNMAL